MIKDPALIDVFFIWNNKLTKKEGALDLLTITVLHELISLHMHQDNFGILLNYNDLQNKCNCSKDDISNCLTILEEHSLMIRHSNCERVALNINNLLSLYNEYIC
jgi:hypothetical protein